MSSDNYGAVAGETADARRAAGMTADCDGNPLGEGDRVAAWRVGVQYTAVVKRIGDYGDGHNENFRKLTLVRDGDGAEVEGFSNLVMVIRPAGALRSRHFPSGHYTDNTGGQGGPARHQCGGCGDPIVSSYDKWLSVFSGQQACRGYWREESEVAAS